MLNNFIYCVQQAEEDRISFCRGHSIHSFSTKQFNFTSVYILC